jgi:hypothetical protein
MKVEWNTLSQVDWYDIYLSLPKTNIIQSYAYAKAARLAYFQDTKFGHITDDSGKTLGLVNMQFINLMGVIQRIFIDRGPLWISSEVAQKYEHEFWTHMNQNYPKRIGRKRRFIPETECPSHELEDIGLIKKADGYETIWLDLAPDIKDLRANFNKKWRNMLTRAEDENLVIEYDEQGLYLDDLLKEYMKDRLKKSYAGASPKFIRTLHQCKTPHEHGRIYLARSAKGHAPVAMIYIFLHGTAATYQIGWSGKVGRDLRANYALIWHAIQDLKASGIRWFDLGGINESSAKGVTRFKRGLGGISYKSPGIYK